MSSINRAGTICHESPNLLETAALALTASIRQLRPILIHLLLRVASHNKRHRFRELEHRAAIQRRKPLSIKLKRNRKNGTLRNMGVCRPAQCIKTARILKHSQIKRNGLLSVRVEPQKRRNAGRAFQCTHSILSGPSKMRISWIGVFSWQLHSNAKSITAAHRTALATLKCCSCPNSSRSRVCSSSTQSF